LEVLKSLSLTTNFKPQV